MKTHQILGIPFFGGSSREAVEEITRRGGLLCAPAAPSMIALCRDGDYRQALLRAEIAIADSGFMVLLWKLFTGESVPRISGLEHVKRLLEHPSVHEPDATVWVVATEASREKLVAFLEGKAGRGQLKAESGSLRAKDEGKRTKEEVSEEKADSGQLKAEPDATELKRRALAAPDLPPFAPSHVPTFPSPFLVHVAPKYRRPVEDPELLALVRAKRPRHVVIAVGGGIQDKLGVYLLEQLDYRPAVHCIGAAVGFLTGDQVRIPDWADKYYLGWFFRSVAQPKVFVPRFWSARRLPWLIWKYRAELPPLGA